MAVIFYVVQFGQEGSLVFEGCHRLRSVDDIEAVLVDTDILQGDIVNAPWEGKYYRGEVVQISREKPTVSKGFKGVNSNSGIR